MRSLVAAIAGLAIAAAPAGAVPVQTMIGHTANYLQSEGFSVGQPLAFAANVGDPISGEVHGEVHEWAFPRGAAAAALPGGVFFDKSNDWPLVVELADRYGVRGKLTAGQQEELETILHEMLHQIGLRSGYYEDIGAENAGDETLRWWEEGITEAVAQDLLPSIARDLYGQRLHRSTETSYEARVRSVRQLSVFATSSGTWNAARATAWRAKLIRRDYSGRQTMIAEAYAAKARKDHA